MELNCIQIPLTLEHIRLYPTILRVKKSCNSENNLGFGLLERQIDEMTKLVRVPKMNAVNDEIKVLKIETPFIKRRDKYCLMFVEKTHHL